MKFLACMPYTEEQKERLRTVAAGHEIVFKALEEVTAEDVQDVEAILGNVPVNLVKQAPKLRWLQTNSAGADQYCKEGVLPSDCMLTNASGAYGTSVSEWMVSASSMLLRKLDLYMRNQVTHAWKDEGDVLSVKNAVVRTPALYMRTPVCSFTVSMIFSIWGMDVSKGARYLRSNMLSPLWNKNTW